MRSSIALHPVVTNHFKILNEFCSKIRNSTELNKMFKEKKCRLRLENNTRWGSAFLLLEVIIKADENKLFENNSETKLPISITRNIAYYNILKSLYLTNINFQSNKSTIGDVIPSIVNIFHRLEKLKLKSRVIERQFIDLLVDQLKSRFHFESNSKIYQVLFVLFS